jgi:hypothetical protein
MSHGGGVITANVRALAAFDGSGSPAERARGAWAPASHWQTLL